MKKYLFLFVLLSSLILTACQSAAATPGVAPAGATPTVKTDNSGVGYPAASTVPDNSGPGYPVASVAPETSASNSYPAPQGTNGSAFPVTAEDANMVKGNFMIDSATLQPVANQPGQADVMAQGSLPTSCNKPRVVVPAPDADKKILIQAYSLTEQGKICAQAIEPFSGKLATLSGLPSGKYTVMVNEVSAGELTVP